MNSRKQIKQVGDTVGGQVINTNQYVLNKLNKLLFLLVLRQANVERETGLEPATSTLARLRSTSWAILALLDNTYSFYLENEVSQTIFNMRRIVKIIKFLCMIFAL